MTESALSLRAVSKRFGSTLALDAASIDVRQGTLHALLGENGAGKTTLMRMAFGLIQPDAGDVCVSGSVRHWRTSADAIGAGLGMVHQHFTIVPALTVAENVALGDRGYLSGFSPGRAAARVLAIGNQTGLHLDPSVRAAELPVGAQQRLEIVKALAHGARLLILDEPTAVLSPQQSAELYAWLRAFVAGGGTVVLITHKLREALGVADAVTVLRHGKTVLTAAVGDVSENAVVTALLGETPAASPFISPSRTTETDSAIVLDSVTVLDARGVPKLHRASLQVQRGEIIGIAGVEGAGQHELLRVLAGRLVPTSGTVRLPARVGFVPEDRLRDALIPSLSLAENVALREASLHRGRMNWKHFHREATDIVARFDVRPADANTAGALSGGNQQKFVLGRELRANPDALIVENPTRGLDIRATDAILARLRAARDAGTAVVVYSSDLDEVLGLADRVVVCYGGMLSDMPADSERVGRAMVGLS